MHLGVWRGFKQLDVCSANLRAHPYLDRRTLTMAQLLSNVIYCIVLIYLIIFNITFLGGTKLEARRIKNKAGLIRERNYRINPKWRLWSLSSVVIRSSHAIFGFIYNFLQVLEPIRTDNAK